MSFNGLPKFTPVNMARKCPQNASFSIENLFFFEDCCFRSHAAPVNMVRKCPQMQVLV